MTNPKTKEEKFYYPWRINLLLILAGIFVLLWKRNFLPGRVPLFYSRPWGEEQLVPQTYLFLLPLLSAAVLIISRQLGQIFFKKEEKFLAWAINSFALLFTVLASITLIKIIFLIT